MADEPKKLTDAEKAAATQIEADAKAAKDATDAEALAQADAEKAADAQAAEGGLFKLYAPADAGSASWGGNEYVVKDGRIYVHEAAIPALLAFGYTIPTQDTDPDAPAAPWASSAGSEQENA